MKDKSKIDDLTGKRFGRLTVIGIKETNTRKTYWTCRCDCGNLKDVRSDSLKAGRIKSCGCLKQEQDVKNLVSPSMVKSQNAGFKRSGTRLYVIWQNMKSRCYNPHDVRYCRYGERGITVCDQWKDDYIAFNNWAIENGYKESLTIDRIDNDGSYSPENCRWVSNKEQARNRSTNISITIGNSKRTLTEWCEIFDLDFKNVCSRYNRNGFISIDDLFNNG